MEYQPWGKIVNISGTRRGVRRCLLSDNQLLREAMTEGCSIRAIWILNSLDAVVFSSRFVTKTMRYNLSASSLVDMPVVQYPVGFLLATLAPSSSSLDLRPRRANVAIGANKQRIMPGETRRAQLCLLHVFGLKLNFGLKKEAGPKGGLKE
ncbi:unnamed protein product [Malus baccata var. baccata]